MRRLVPWGIIAALLVGMVVIQAVPAGHAWAWWNSRGHIHGEVEVPAAPVALVLGAQVYADGQPSAFLAARLEVARRLFEAGKVRVILVSGDNMNFGYNEPVAMRQWLVDHGVPEERVVLDYAGFDTYDSCARASRIFGVTRAIVVTQSFHLPRAVALCRQLGIDADGVGDDSVRVFRDQWGYASIRERGAMAKMMFDVTSGRDPVHLGPHETGVEDALRAG